MARLLVLLALAALAIRCALFPSFSTLSGDGGPQYPVVHGTSSVQWVTKGGGGQFTWSVTPPVGAVKGDLLVVFIAHDGGTLTTNGLAPPLAPLISGGICESNGNTAPLDIAYAQYDGVTTSYSLTSIAAHDYLAYGAIVYAIGGRAPLSILNIDDKKAKTSTADAGSGAAPAVTVQHDAAIVLALYAVLDPKRDAVSTFGDPARLLGPSDSNAHMVAYSGSFPKGLTPTFDSDAGPPTCWGMATVAVGD